MADRFHWTLLSILFLSSYILCFFISESGSYVACTLLNGVVAGIECHSYSDCIYFKYLFYYTRIILPILHIIPFLIWFYSNVLLGLSTSVQNQLALALCPLLTAIVSPCIANPSDKLLKISIPLQTFYMIPLFILLLMILCDRSCYAETRSDTFSQISCKLLISNILIHIVYYMDLIQYLSFKYLTRKITTIYHDYLIPISILSELLLFIMFIFHCFYINDPNYPNSFDIKAPIIYIISIPLIFPVIYYKYYYKYLDPNKLSILFHFDKKSKLHKTTESMVERIYAFIHIMCHTMNSYDIIYNVECKKSNASIKAVNINNKSITIPLMIDNEYQNGIIRHNNDITLCLQYQNYFMRLSLDDKIKYICMLAPYCSKFYASKHSIKCPKCKDNNLCLTYFCLFLKLIGNIAPIFWFGYIYLYQCNGHDIIYYGPNSWLFYEGHHKYQHFLITILMSIYFIICMIWIFFVIQVFSKEYYYGFIRTLLINKTDENDDNAALTNKVQEFHTKMVRCNEIVKLLESQDIITHVAIEIVSYLSH